MGKRRRIQAEKRKLLQEEEEEEEERRKSVVVLNSSSDEEEGNRDLSLEIVEKARKREDKRKEEVSSTGSVPKNVRSDRVVDSYSSSSSDEIRLDEAKDVEDQNFGVMEKVTKRGTKRKRKDDLRVANRKSFRADTVSDLSLVSPSINSDSGHKDEIEKEEEKVIENDQKFVRWIFILKSSFF